MKLKSAIAAIAATTALTGAVFLTETAQAKPCIFSGQSGFTDSAPSSDPATPTTTQADLSNFNKLGVGASFAVLGGLLGGGVMLKRRFDRQSAPLMEAQTEALPNQLAEPTFASSEFAIEIPPEVLQEIRTSESSDLTSVK